MKSCRGIAKPWIWMAMAWMSLFSCSQEDHPGQRLTEVFIPLSDGVRLAADLYLPGDFDSTKSYPVVLEYLPYRKDEHRRNRFGLFSYFTQRGYIIARVDIRGTGRSEGHIVPYEYSEQEQKDGEEVIAWLASQVWSGGSVGMFGISWGGFNALQLAMRQPPALKAIVSLMSTDDLYQDDVHYIDGIMHVDAYEIGRDLDNALPAPPDYILDSSYFANRFDSEPWLLKYKMMQRDGPFWDRASLNSAYDRINIPCFLIGGVYDGYRDFPFRFAENSKVPKRILMGPWNHSWPNWGDPPPAVEWRDLAVKWFDHWLKGEENGIMGEAPVTVYQRDYHAPGMDLEEIPGDWRFYKTWPPLGQDSAVFYFAQDNTLKPNTGKDNVDKLETKVPDAIAACGSVMWWGDWAKDQAGVDESSLVYETAEMDEELELMGFPVVELHFSSDSEKCNWYVRLNDVAPDGKVTLVTGAALNGSYISSSEEPARLIKDSIYKVSVELHFTSWRFRRGHRLRISLSNEQWPMFWPSPERIKSRLFSGGNYASHVILPKGMVSDAPEFVFSDPVDDEEIQGYASVEEGTGSGFAEMNEQRTDPETGNIEVLARNRGTVRYPWSVETNEEEIIHYASVAEPSRAGVRSIYSIRLDPEGKPTIYLKGNLHFHSKKDSFYYVYSREIYSEDSLLREKSWRRSFEREGQ